MLKGLVQSGVAARPLQGAPAPQPVRHQARVHRRRGPRARCSPKPSWGARRRRPETPRWPYEPSDRMTATEDESSRSPQPDARSRRLCRPAPARRSDQRRSAGPSRGAPTRCAMQLGGIGLGAHDPLPRDGHEGRQGQRRRGTIPDNRLVLATGPARGAAGVGHGRPHRRHDRRRDQRPDLHPGQRVLRDQPQVLRLRRHRHPGPVQAAGSISTSTTTSSSCATPRALLGKDTWETQDALSDDARAARPPALGLLHRSRRREPRALRRDPGRLRPRRVQERRAAPSWARRG